MKFYVRSKQPRHLFELQKIFFSWEIYIKKLFSISFQTVQSSIDRVYDVFIGWNRR